VVVEPGAQLRIDGDLGGDIVVRAGGAAYVAGAVGGDATIDGALMIAGDVGGDFVVRPGGEFTNRASPPPDRDFAQESAKSTEHTPSYGRE